jgi:hypothetical protein
MDRRHVLGPYAAVFRQFVLNEALPAGGSQDAHPLTVALRIDDFLSAVPAGGKLAHLKLSNGSVGAGCRSGLLRHFDNVPLRPR